MNGRMHRNDHPFEDSLAAYLLDELDPAERSAVEAHLASCPRCHATLTSLEDSFAASVELLEPVAPPRTSWDEIERRVRADRSDGRSTAAPPIPPPSDGGRSSAARTLPAWAIWGWAATFLVAVALGAWGVQHRSAAVTAAEAIADLEARVALLESVTNTIQARADGLATEQGRLVRWLARTDVVTRRLPPADDGVARGSVLFLPDQRALVAMRDPAPDGVRYVAWGEEPDGSLSSLAAFSTRTTEVDAAPFGAVLVSAEADADVATPTAPLGRVEVP